MCLTTIYVFVYYKIQILINLLCPDLFVMAYVRSKKVKGHTYYYIVEGKLDKEGKVKQKVILYLGNVENVLKVFKFYKEKNSKE